MIGQLVALLPSRRESERPPTFCSAAEVDDARATQSSEQLRAKDGNCADTQPQTSPEPLDDSLLDDPIQHSHAERSVDVLDEGEVGTLDQVLLRFGSSKQGDLLGVLEESRMSEAVRAFERRRGRGVATERRGRELDWRRVNR